MNYNIPKLAIVALSVIASLGSLSAAGTLGVRSASANWVTLDSQDKDTKSAYGGSVNFNIPVHRSVDVTVDYGQLRLVQEGVTFTDSQTSIGALYHEAFENTDDKLKLFVGGSVGGIWDNAKGYGQKFSESSWKWELTTGVEYEIVKDLSASVAVAYQGAPDITDEKDTVFIGRANYWITERFGVNASFSINEESDRLITAGAGIRF